MKIVLAVAVVLAMWTSTTIHGAGDQSDKPTMRVCTLKVSGMTCAGCEAAVKMAARSVEGVKEVKASYEKKNAEVTYDQAKTTPDAIAKVITEKSGSRPKPFTRLTRSST
jgi:copper chaperone CopZ